MASAADLLATWGSNPQAVDGMQLYTFSTTMYNEMMELKKRLEVGDWRGTGERKSITDRKGFEKLKNYNGGDKDFSDWEFQLQQFLRP